MFMQYFFIFLYSLNFIYIVSTNLQIWSTGYQYFNTTIIRLKWFFMHFCPGTMTPHSETINSDLQRGLHRRLRHTTLNTEQNQLAIKVSAEILPQR